MRAFCCISLPYGRRSGVPWPKIASTTNGGRWPVMKLRMSALPCCGLISVGLLLAALIAPSITSLPIISAPAFIAIIVAVIRVPFLGVDCKEETITVHGLFWGRRIPLSRIVGLEVLPQRMPHLRWISGVVGENERYRDTPIRAFGWTRYSTVTMYNQDQLKRLQSWISNHQGHPLPKAFD